MERLLPRSGCRSGTSPLFSIRKQRALPRSGCACPLTSPFTFSRGFYQPPARAFKAGSGGELGGFSTTAQPPTRPAQLGRGSKSGCVPLFVGLSVDFFLHFYCGTTVPRDAKCNFSSMAGFFCVFEDQQFFLFSELKSMSCCSLYWNAWRFFCSTISVATRSIASLNL